MVERKGMPGEPWAWAARRKEKGGAVRIAPKSRCEEWVALACPLFAVSSAKLPDSMKETVNFH